MQKQKVKIEAFLSSEPYMSGTDVKMKYDGKVIVDLYVLPNGGLVIHNSGEILINQSLVTLKEYIGESTEKYWNIKFKKEE
jgi:hypothetical protein